MGSSMVDFAAERRILRAAMSVTEVLGNDHMD